MLGGVVELEYKMGGGGFELLLMSLWGTRVLYKDMLDQ